MREAENRIREVIPISFLNVVATPAIDRFALRLDDKTACARAPP